MEFIKRNRNIILLATIFVFGFFLRVAGYDWGGNLIYQPDEPKLVDPVIDMANRHSILSYDYYYPNQFLSKFQAIAVMLYRFVYNSGDKGVLQAYWICRIVTAVFGALTIILVYMIGERLKEKVGLISAGIFAVSPYLVIMSKQVTGDIGALFGSSITMLSSIEYGRDKKYRYLVLMTLGSAIAMMEKWHGGGGTVYIALIVLIYAVSFKDFVIRGIIALSSFFLWIFVIAPNVILNPKQALYDGFIRMAVHKGEPGPSYFALLWQFIEESFLHIGGAVYVIAVLLGLIIAVLRKEKKYCVLLFGVIKVLQLSFLNRGFWRWGLELYLTEILCIAICVEWLFAKPHRVYKVISIIISAVILIETATATLCIDMVAIRDEQDNRTLQEQFCGENGITIDNTVSTPYSAFFPTGPRAGGVSERAKNDLSNVIGHEDGQLVRLTDKLYYVWTDYPKDDESLVMELDEKGLCMWTSKFDYWGVFANPIWSIEHSWNDLILIGNNIKAIKNISNGAIIGTYYIKIYDISSLPISKNYDPDL